MEIRAIMRGAEMTIRSREGTNERAFFGFFLFLFFVVTNNVLQVVTLEGLYLGFTLLQVEQKGKENETKWNGMIVLDYLGLTP